MPARPGCFDGVADIVLIHRLPEPQRPTGASSRNAGATSPPETTSPTATTLEASTGERGLKIPMLPEQLAAAIPRLDGQLVIVQGRMDPERVPCPTGPAGCWAGRLAGYAGPPILAAPDGPADWDGSAVGRPVLAIDHGEARYVGQLGMSGAMRVAHPSTLVKPLDDADGLVLVEGRVNADCGASSGGCSIGIDDGISAGEVLQPVLAEPGRPPAHGGVGRFVLRWGDVAHSCPSTTGPGAPSCASPIGLPWTFVGWVAGDAIRTQPVPTCDGVDGDLCAALADLAVGDTPDVVSIDVGPFGGNVFTRGRRDAHRRIGQSLDDCCDTEGSELGCRSRFGTEPNALAIVRVVVDGVASRYVVFTNAQGMSFDLTVDRTATISLTRGQWQMFSTDVPPPGPPNDLCSSTLDVHPGDRLELRITVTNGVCAQQVAPDASPRS